METENMPIYSMEIEIKDQENVEDVLIEKYNAERIIWTDLTSSSGSWSGLIVKKIGEDECDLIEFFQEIGFDSKKIYVGESIVKYPIPMDCIDEAIENYYDMYYGDGSFDDFEDVEEEEDKPSKHSNEKILEIQFDD